MPWVEENVMAAKSAVDYLRTAPIGSEDQDRHLGRVIDLGELLFNLQRVPGIEKRLETLQTDTTKIEDTVAELVAVKLLVVNGVPVRFIDPIGQKGFDYDIEFLLSSGEKVCCDVKCKVDSAELNIATIGNALESARKQLPKDGFGFIVVKLPEQWSKQDNVIPILSDAVEKLFRQTQRIVSIIAYADEFAFVDPHFMGRVIVSKEFVNPNSRGANVYKGDLLKEAQAIGIIPNWIQFHGFE
jgi:hypothetical protein